MCIQGLHLQKLGWCATYDNVDNFSTDHWWSLLAYRSCNYYAVNPGVHYQGPGVLCTLIIGISAVVYFFALTDKFPCKCNI